MRSTHFFAAVALVALVFVNGSVAARLPAAPAADPVKAEEAKKKAAETTKIEGDLLARYQDKAAANFKKAQGKPGPSKAQVK
ncbi:MAG: hypothetical protein EXR27_02265 [Betaproteobacteria bacterium]|nr:hypothetical protein [Betaproteobacteria bacterium]